MTVFVLVMYDVIPTVVVSVTTGGAKVVAFPTLEIVTGVAVETNVVAIADGVTIVGVVGSAEEEEKI